MENEKSDQPSNVVNVIEGIKAGFGLIGLLGWLGFAANSGVFSRRETEEEEKQPMKAIIINEQRLDALFEKCLDKLKLEKFQQDNRDNPEAMHRAFHYHVCILKDEIKAEK